MRTSIRCFIVLLSLILGYHIVAIWRGMILAQSAASTEGLLKAIEIGPDNPIPFHKLGLLHQLSFLQFDPKESDRCFREAIARNPLEQEYHLGLASGIRLTGGEQQVRSVLDNAIRVFPTGYRGRWITGNVLLEQGDVERALLHFSYILTHYPGEAGLVYDVIGTLADDPEFVLDELIPKDPACLKQYLDYVYGLGDKKLARRVWEKKAAFGFNPGAGETLRHIDFLIAKGDLHQAFDLWKGTTASPAASGITNGGFEADRSGGTGFDWKIERVGGADIFLDDSISFEGKRSLRITFDGKENVDFQQVGQVVSWEPETEYSLKAFMRTKGITTKSGLKMEVVGIGPTLYAASESLCGDNEWKELSVRFRTPPESEGGQIRLRRNSTDKFDRFISGEAWIDDVRLSKVPPGEGKS